MSNISLGGYTFLYNPARMTAIKPERSTGKVDTYSSVGFFSWGSSIVGKEITMEWDVVEKSLVDELDTLYAADETIILDPQDGSEKTYNVEIESFDWDYHIYSDVDTAKYRKNVKMTLLIMSEV
jgi:hypothetical protein